MIGNLLCSFCGSIHRLHYEISLESTSTAPTPLTLSCQYSQYGSSPNGPSSPSDISMKVGSAGFFNSTPHSVPGLPQPPRQKGRPRKRKPKDIESMTANLGKMFKQTLIEMALHERKELKVTRRVNSMYRFVTVTVMSDKYRRQRHAKIKYFNSNNNKLIRNKQINKLRRDEENTRKGKTIVRHLCIYYYGMSVLYTYRHAFYKNRCKEKYDFYHQTVT